LHIQRKEMLVKPIIMAKHNTTNIDQREDHQGDRNSRRGPYTRFWDTSPLQKGEVGEKKKKKASTREGKGGFL